MAVDEVQAFALAARNLALAENAPGGANGKPRRRLLAPCAAAISSSSRPSATSPSTPTSHAQGHCRPAGHRSVLRGRRPGPPPPGRPGERRRAASGSPRRVTQPLKGLKVACYYGCQVVRPFATFDTAHNPTTMDRLVKALGATPVRLALEDPMLRGHPERHDPRGRPPPQPDPSERGEAPQGGRHRHRVPPLPVQPRVLPGRNAAGSSMTMSGFRSCT